MSGEGTGPGGSPYPGDQPPYGGQQPPTPDQPPQYGQPPASDQPPGWGAPTQPPQPPAYGQQPPPQFGQQPPPAYGQQPQYGQPQYGSPGYPQGQYQAYAGYLKRPGKVTAAAVLGFVSGGLSVIGALIILSISSALDNTTYTSSQLSTLKVISVIALGVSLLYIVGGVLALSGKTFNVLIAGAGIAVVINVVSMLSSNGTAFLGFILPILIIVFLLSGESKTWLAARQSGRA